MNYSYVLGALLPANVLLIRFLVVPQSWFWKCEIPRNSKLGILGFVVSNNVKKSKKGQKWLSLKAMACDLASYMILEENQRTLTQLQDSMSQGQGLHCRGSLLPLPVLFWYLQDFCASRHCLWLTLAGCRRNEVSS